MRHLEADWEMCIHIRFIITFFGHKVKVFFTLCGSFLDFFCFCRHFCSFVYRKVSVPEKRIFIFSFPAGAEKVKF